MKNLPIYLLIFLGMLGWAQAAYADIDQACLKQCIGNGVASGGCLSQCSYGNANGVTSSTSLAPATPTALTPDLGAKHGVLNAAQISNAPVVIQRKATPPAPTKNYACFNQCLHDGKTYALCEANCTQTVCTAAMVLCHNVLSSGPMDSAANGRPP